MKRLNMEINSQDNLENVKKIGSIVELAQLE